MQTDKPPRKIACKDEFTRSDALLTVKLPSELKLRALSAELEEALKAEERASIQVICNKIAKGISEPYEIDAPKIKILGVRPLEESGGMIHETYGDYTFDTAQIRLWMRTAVREKPTSFGTLLSTLCHEICHHLDVVSLEMPNTFHTRGFYERAGILYHHVRGTPRRVLVWDPQKSGAYSINWPQTMRGGTVKV